MKLGVMLDSLPGDWDLEVKLKAVAECGYDGVEFGFGLTGPVSVESTEEELDKVKELVKKYGLELYSLAGSMYWGTSLTSDSPEIREEGKRYLRRHIEVAAYLGCETILVVPGYVHVDFLPNCPIVDYDVVYNRALEWIEEIKPYAEEKNVEIGIENVWNKFLLSPVEMRDFIDKADSKYVGVYFDAGNVVLSGFPEHWIKVLGSRIKKVHFKDYRRAIGDLNGFVDLLSGDIDYVKVNAALKEIGYDGWVTAELGFGVKSPGLWLKNTYNAMKEIVNS